MKTWIALAVGLALASPAMAQTVNFERGGGLPSPTETLRDRALKDTTAWEIVESLTTQIGARPAGSPAALRARDWAVTTFRRYGFENIRVEEYKIDAWVRGDEKAEILGEFSRPLSILGLGRSISTPAGGLEGEVAVFGSYAQMLSSNYDIRGKIVLVNQPMVRMQDGSGYGAIVQARTQGASEAARRGAIAYLVRSLATDDANNPHTGAMRYAEGVAQIPAAAISVPDANVLDRLSRQSKVKIRLVLNSTSVPGASAWDVSGEIVGRERPDEIIVIGGHLDSWDVGTGAVDDAAGIAITTAAAKLVGAVQKPKRTIRVVMWGSEEMGDSGARYARDHAAEMPKIIAASESDNGAGRILAVSLPAGARAKPELQGLATLLAPLKVNVVPTSVTRSGADTDGLHQGGVPAFSFRQDTSRYFDLHHSRNDTLEQVDPQDLAQNVAAWFVVLGVIANSGVDLRAVGAVK